MLIDERHRGCRSELAVGLVDDDQPAIVAGEVEHGAHGLGRIDHTGGVIRRTQEHDFGLIGRDHLAHDVEIQVELLGTLPDHDLGANDAGDVAV